MEIQMKQKYTLYAYRENGRWVTRDGNMVTTMPCRFTKARVQEWFDTFQNQGYFKQTQLVFENPDK